MRLRTLALGAILGVGTTSIAAAQTGAPTMPTLAQRRLVDIDAQVGAYYDTNITRGSKQTAINRGLKQQDYTVTPALNLNIAQPIGSQMVFAQGSVGYDFHARNSRLDRERFDIKGGLAGQIGPCRPILYETWQVRQSDLAETDATTSKNRQEALGPSVGLTCGRDRGFSGVALASRVDTKNSATRMVVQDSTTKSLMAGLTYAAPSFVTASLIFNYGATEFPNRINPGRPVGDSYFVQAYGLRLERKFGSRIQTSAMASRMHLKREFAPVGTPLTLNTNAYQADIAYRANTRATVTISAAREIKPSNRVGKLYDISESLDGRVVYRLNSRYDVTLGHTYEQLNSNADTGAVNRAVITNSRTNTTFGTLSIRRIGPANLEFDVRRERRDTNLPLFDYKSIRVGLITRVSF